MRGYNFLIEGIDLAGKSTLAKSLPRELEKLGFDIRQSRNALCPANPIALLADELRKDPDAGDAETASLFLASHLWDARNFSPVSCGCIHIQDSCWVRTLAHHLLQGTPEIPAVLRNVSKTFPRFDGAVFLTADIDVRQERFGQREMDEPGSNDHGDRLVITKPEKFQELDKLLWSLCEELFGAVRINTTTLSKDDVLGGALKVILPAVHHATWCANHEH